MLQKLTIHNYVIIDHLVIEPDGHLNIVTGETGAGKSIILGALSLILGERADTSVLINKGDKCIVEACFDVKDNTAFREALAAADLDEGDDQCIIRREISSKGKSRIFINDIPVTLSTLSRLTAMLVDLHQQFDQLDIRNTAFQLEVLDALAGNGAALAAYRALYTRYRQVRQELAALEAQQARMAQEQDFRQYLLEELTAADFREQEIEQAEQELKTLTHAEQIIEVLRSSRYVLEEGEQPVTSLLRKAAQQLQGIAGFMEEAGTLEGRINAVRVELDDVARELEQVEEKVTLDPERMEMLRQRLDLGYKLLKKHALQNTGGLLELRQQLEAEVRAGSAADMQLGELNRQRDTLYKELQTAATALSGQRAKVLPELISQVNRLIALTGMPDARFEVRLTGLEEPGADGKDDVAFLLDANRSGVLQSVYKAASGGELSRIMLAVKSVTARAMHLPVLVFDEVDTGISGEAARQVGLLLHDLAAYHQIICITHLPQVAAKGTRHFYVYKKDAEEGQRIHTRIRTLEGAEHIHAIARMIGGDPPTEAALRHAGELVDGEVSNFK